MFAHVSVKKDRFEALLRFLISDTIQPFKNPLVIGRTPNFFEGAKVNSVTISASPHERQLGERTVADGNLHSQRMQPGISNGRLQSCRRTRCSDGKLYVGSTADLKRRIKEHEGGLVPATSYRLPAKLVYYEACRSQLEARRRELQLKTGFRRRSFKARLGM